MSLDNLALALVAVALVLKDDIADCAGFLSAVVKVGSGRFRWGMGGGGADGGGGRGGGRGGGHHSFLAFNIPTLMELSGYDAVGD